VAKAKSLLADAGYPNGLDIKLSVTASVPGMLDVAQAWQQVVKDAGINVTLNQFPGETYWTKAWLVEPAYMDYWLRALPPIYFDYFYRKDAAFPETHFDDPKLDKLVLELLSTTDQSQQVALTQQGYEEGRKSFSYLIPAFVDGAVARSSKVNGMTWYVGLPDFRKAWLA
jgi:peptide/nickel transport system substrate-binding protein